MAKTGAYEGQVLDGRYRVERLLGEGGMGSVYEGRHVLVGKRVAIKILHAEFAASEDILKRFYREAQAAAAIGHKNIIDIFDVGVTPNNEPYIAMEYLEGEDLDSLLEREGKLTLDAACGILEPTLQALDAAHAKGIVHRDLKPANIFLVREKGRVPVVKLIDFGISKFTGMGGTKLTQAGALLGTPAYMSPEQARGDDDVDQRTDIYAMGVILYEMLTGRQPFKGAHYNELLINVLSADPVLPREIEPSIPEEAEALVLRTLSKEASERSQSALELLDELQRLGAFGKRESGLSLLGTRIECGVAGGDLGKSSSVAGRASSASQVLSEMARTPGIWTAAGVRRSRRGLLVAGIAGGLLLVVGVAALFGLRAGEPDHVLPSFAAQAAKAVAEPDAPDHLDAPDAPEDREKEAHKVVEITVVGAPEGATILYEGTPVPANPFPVELKNSMARLEVRAPGFEPYVTSVIPSKDTAAEVELKPLPQARPPAAGAKAAKATKPATEQDAEPEPRTQYREGRIGAKVGTEFE